MNLPNKLTILRILLTFVFMFFLFCKGVGAKAAALVTFAVASLTDLYDGYLAKKYNLHTEFGKLMDPIADKILTLAAFLAFVELELVAAWMVAVIVLRELLITGLRLHAVHKGVVLAAETAGKHKMVSQVISIFAILVFILLKEIGLSVAGFWTAQAEYFYRQTIFIMMLITTALTVISGVSHLYKNRKVYLGA